MSKTVHNSLDEELLYLIGRATSHPTSAWLYENSKLADEVTQVATTLNTLQQAGKIVRVDGPGRARYKLGTGVATPAPAGKAGRRTAEHDAGAAGGLPVIDIPQPSQPQPPTPSAEPSAPASSAAGIADAIIARLKRDFAPTVTALAKAVGTEQLQVHVHIARIEIRMGGL